MMTRQTAVALMLAALTLTTAAHADTLRCGSKLIAEGESQSTVRAKCGTPDSETKLTEPIYARNPYGGVAGVVGESTKIIWRYQRSPGKFPAVLTFEGGVLKKLEFEK
jgi:hypothetical protein